MLLCHVCAEAGGREEPPHGTRTAHKITGGCGCRWGATVAKDRAGQRREEGVAALRAQGKIWGGGNLLKRYMPKALQHKF